MCGIIGYSGLKEAAPILLEGLRKLEYRGYDSCGMVTSHEGSVSVKKDVGSIDDVHSKHDFHSLKGNTGIAHCRWATHGRVNDKNSHPHSSNNEKISAVQNGIIENFQELREFLKGQGYLFKSETDTEIVPILIEHEMKEGKSFINACKAAFSQLEGRNAIVAVNPDGEIVATRRGSPLVMGIGEGEHFIASDIPSFMNHTKNVIYLKDDDLVHIRNGEYSISNILDPSDSERPIESIDWDESLAEKGDFKHFMMKEIAEQSETVKKVMDMSMNEITAIGNEIKNADNVFLVGCGTAYFACVTGRYMLSEIAGKNVIPVRASEMAHMKHLITDKSLVIAVSQSGETAETLEAISLAKENGAKITSLVNVPRSAVDRESETTVHLNAGPEIGVASTKAYTSQITSLALMSHCLNGGIEHGKKTLGYAINHIYDLTAVTTRAQIKSLANILKDQDHLYFVGYGAQYPTAKEAALKVKEISYIHAEAMPAGEFKHGTIALIEENTPVIFFFSEEDKKDIITSAQEVKSRGGYIIGVGPENNPTFDFFIKVNDSGIYNPIVQVVPMQILAYQLSVLRGNNPDKPRNLAKSVTVK